MFNWLKKNRKWVFSGIGVSACVTALNLFFNNQKEILSKQSQVGTGNIQAGGDVTVIQSQPQTPNFTGQQKKQEEALATSSHNKSSQINSFNEANAGPRIALVIGINKYKDFMLRNAISDAEAVSKKLEERGFKILKCPYDANKDELTSCIQIFQKILGTGGVGVFYYAGSAFEIEGTNYLFPSNSSLSLDKNNLIASAVNLDEILKPVDNLIKSKVGNNGSAIIYATDKGQIAADGSEEHSPFAEALLPLIENHSYELNELFRQLRTDVKKISNGLQTPWISSSLDTEFYFSPPKKERIGVLKILFLDSCRTNPFQPVSSTNPHSLSNRDREKPYNSPLPQHPACGSARGVSPRVLETIEMVSRDWLRMKRRQIIAPPDGFNAVSSTFGSFLLPKVRPFTMSPSLQRSVWLLWPLLTSAQLDDQRYR